jgi:hypothetical protein
MLAYALPDLLDINYRSIIIDYFEDFLREEFALAYIYFDYKDKETHSAKNIAANILKQLLSRSDETPHDLLQLFEKARNNPRHFKELKELREWILKCAEYLPSVVIILDALDECENTFERTKIISFLNDLSKDGVKILITSRTSLPKPMNDIPILEARAKDSDIDAYVRARLGEVPLEIDPELLEDLEPIIIRSIQSNANGMSLA